MSAGFTVELVAESSETYEVLAVSQGSLATGRSHVYLNHDLYGDPDAPMEVRYYFWILRNAHRTVLVDTGFSSRGATSRGRRIDRPFTEALQQLGIEPRAVEDVIVSHAHYDHVGNLSDLPAARIWIAREEFDFWTSPASRHRLFRTVVDGEDIDELLRASEQGRVRWVDGDGPVFPGISLVRVPGHTPGQLCVVVNTVRGVVVLATDAAHFDEELSENMPFRHLTDLVAMYDSLARLRELSKSGAVMDVIPGHDPAVAGRYPALSGELAHVAVIAPA